MDKSPAKAKASKIVLKEIRFGPNTDDHDFNFKLNHARKFIEEGAKIKAEKFPTISLVILLLSAIGIYFGADYTIISLEKIATDLSITKSSPFSFLFFTP